MDHAVVTAALAACELNDQEMEGYKAVMTLIEKRMIDAGQAGGRAGGHV